MKEICNLAISPQVLPLTLLLVPVALYWVLNILGVLDLEFLDVEVDADGPDESDSTMSQWLHGALRIVNAKDVPVMVVLSILVILLWACAMIGNLWFNPGSGALAGGIIALGALAAAVVLTRFAVAPLKPFFRVLRAEDEKHLPVIGRTGFVRTALVDERSGQVEVQNSEAPLLLSARVLPGTAALPRDTEVIVVSHDPASGVYTVRSLSESIPPNPS